MENTIQKNILETNLQLSTAYTIAFGKPTSKFEIQKYLTKSKRHTTIVDTYKECFKFMKRTDNRMGFLIQSKPEILIDLIEAKIKLDPKSKIYLNQLLTNVFIGKSINRSIYMAIKSHYRPINHNLLLKYIAVIFLGSYINKEYGEFFKPKIKQNDYLKKSNFLDKKFLPELYYKDKQTKHDKYSLQMREILSKFNHDTKKELISLYPDYRLLIRLVKQGIIISETNK